MAEGDGDGTRWGDALERAFDRNGRNGRPTSMRALAKELAAASGGRPTQDSWITDLKRIRRTDRASEEKAQKIAAALGVSRRSLPPATGRLKVADVERRLEAVERRALGVEDLGPILHVLELLATGKRAEALRVLSEVEGP